MREHVSTREKNMIEKLTKEDLVGIDDFNKDTLKKLKSYFDIQITEISLEEHSLWMRNLLVLGQHNLSLAHCVQHNQSPRGTMEAVFKGKQYPNFYDHTFGNTIGCYSNVKSADTMTLNGTTISGTKQWISMVHQADYGIFRVPVNDTEAYVLIDFATFNPKIEFDHVTPIGMQMARPGSITFDNYTLPEECIIGYRHYHELNQVYFYSQNNADYAFITNYLALITALFRDLSDYVEQRKINIDFEIKKLGLAISGLLMIWENNLSTLEEINPNHAFWHLRNTQYTMSKNTLLDLIHLILQVCDATWMDAHSQKSQRLRDALTFCSHMKPLYKNLEEKHFIKF
jgi:hypothetical protein